MSDTILAGDLTVYYITENRQKRIEWSGAATGNRTVKETYLALQDLFDGQTQMRETEPMKADTPTDFTIGRIDTNDPDAWFIDQTTVEHLTGAVLRTTGWDRVSGTDTGIVRVTCNNTNIVAGDIGQDITHGDGDAGTLLDVKGTGAGSELWIRPDSEAAANNFDSTSGTLTEQGSSHTATQSAASVDGESLWSNPYSVASLALNTHVYIYQDGALLTEYKATDIDSWWGRDHIDILVLVKVVGSLIDEGYITTLARQYGYGDTYNVADLSAGVRFPVPLETAVDRDNPTGYRTFTGSSGSGTFEVGEEIIGATSGANGIVTAVGGTTTVPILEYYLLDDLTDFTNTEQVDGQESSAQCNAGTPANNGPALLSGLSITHGNTTADIDEDGTSEYYSITIDCSDELLTDVWEWLKYVTRRGETGTTNTDGIPAEYYLGNDYAIAYTSLNGTISEGAEVTQDNTGATGTVVAHHTTPDILILRNSRGSFNDTDIVRVDGTNYVSGPTSTLLVPVKQSPFGAFAGGKFFGADGVLLTNYLASDENNFSLIDDEQTVREAPLKVTVAVGNTRVGDQILLARTSGGFLDTSEYTVDSGQGAAGSTSLQVDPAITADTPATGRVVVVDVDGGVEHYYRYTSWTGDTFTLYTVTGNTLEGGDANTAIDTGAFANTEVGDVFRNTTEGDWAYVIEVTDNDTIQLSKDITGNGAGDSYEVGTTIQSYTTSDEVWVPFILVYETTGTDGSPGTEQTSVAYSTPIPVLIRVRNAAGTYDIKPFVTTGSIGSTGFSVNTVRNPETIT